MNISISNRGSSFSIKNTQTITIGDQTFEVDGNMTVVIEVHGDVHGKVKTMSGDVMIAGSSGDIETMSGDVKVVGSSGSIKTMSGSISVRKP